MLLCAVVLVVVVAVVLVLVLVLAVVVVVALVDVAGAAAVLEVCAAGPTVAAAGAVVLERLLPQALRTSRHSGRASAVARRPARVRGWSIASR